MTILGIAERGRGRPIEGMMANEAELVRMVSAIVQRFFRQNGRAELEGDGRAEAMARRLADVVARRGAGCGVTDAEILAFAGAVAGEGAEPLLQDAAKQLVKACFYPELAVCRDSFREVGRDGACRRQELARARGRVSGSHCVDCPHWVALAPGAHAAMLEREWMRGAEEFAAAREVFLPEDFRELRRWLRGEAPRAC